MGSLPGVPELAQVLVREHTLLDDACMLPFCGDRREGVPRVESALLGSEKHILLALFDARTSARGTLKRELHTLT